MKTKHLFEDAYYLISNKAVAKCFMFRDEIDCERIKTNIDKHLSPIIDVLAFGFTHDAFQLIVKLKSRKIIETYYRSKYGERMEVDNFIPESTYIFAQAMANMQSGYVKYFNFKYERDGGLMKGRYDRRLIESVDELEKLRAVIHAMEIPQDRSAIWTFRRKGDGFRFDYAVDEGGRSSKLCYEEGKVEVGTLKCLKLFNEYDVRGHFDILPPKRLEFENNQIKIRNLICFLMMKV